MKKTIFYATIASLAFVGCTKDDVATDFGQKTKISATFEQEVSSTRLNIASDNALTWSADDAFALFGEDGSSYEFTLQSGEGTASAVFEGTTPSVIKGAAFPYEDEHSPSLSGTTLTMNLPDVLDQSANGKCNLPMWAETESATNISFKHLAGVLRINFTDMPEGYNSLIVTASNPISGAFTAEIDDETIEPVLVSDSEDEKAKKVTITFTEATADANDNVFYIPLPKGEYESIKIAISNGQDTKNLVTYNDKEVERAMIYTASLTYSNVTGTLVTEVDTPAELKAAIAAGGYIKLVDHVTFTERLQINKENDVVLDLNNKTLTFENNNSGEAKDIYAFYNFGSIKIINGTLEAKGNYLAVCLYNEGTAVVNCNMTSSNSNVIKVDNGGILTINGGKYVSEANPTGQAVRVGNWKSGQASAWKLYINGGEFVAKWAGLYIVNNYEGLGDNIGTAVIKNATFTGSESVVDTGVKGSDIVFDKVKNVTIENCTLTTSSIHSETTGQSVIKTTTEHTITTTDNVYSELFNNN